jgi:2-polyprenyl-3-methyl-5-hydroxy-6-metoxy-1,4-benzoquinol methylase
MSGKTRKTCAVCESTNFYPIAEEQYKESLFRIARCGNCRALFTFYREANHNADYGIGDEESFNRKYLPIVQGKKLHDRHENYLEMVQIIKRNILAGRYLDVGCHGGWLLGYLQKDSNLELFGLEPSPFLAHLASKRLGISVFNDSIRSGVLSKEWFDGIGLTDVLEHLENPNEAIRALREALKGGGKLFIKVPNGDFALWKYRLRGILHFLSPTGEIFDAKEHFVLYNRGALRILLEKNGLRVREFIVPKPIQTGGSSWAVRLARSFFYRIGKIGLLPPQDILVIAEKI